MIFSPFVGYGFFRCSYSQAFSVAVVSRVAFLRRVLPLPLPLPAPVFTLPTPPARPSPPPLPPAPNNEPDDEDVDDVDEDDDDDDDVFANDDGGKIGVITCGFVCEPAPTFDDVDDDDDEPDVGPAVPCAVVEPLPLWTVCE